MLRVILIIVAAIAISIFCLSGCKKGPSESDSEQEVVKPVAEYTESEYQEETDEPAEEYEEEMAGTAAEQEEEVLKTSVEYQEDAQREITLANMETELRKIEQELQRDLAEEER